MYSKKINQLATNLNPQSTDLIPIGDAETGQLKTTTFDNISGITGDGVISGGIVTWTGTGLIFNISACTYVLNGVRYSSPFTTKTLDAADPTYDRIDVFSVNTSGQVEVIKGTPALNPVEPEGDTSTTLGLTNVTIVAGATTPNNVSRDLIYDENVESWTKTASVTPGSYNFADTAYANTGTKSILITQGAGFTLLKFSKATAMDISSYKSVSFAIRLNTAWTSNQILAVTFYNGTNQVSNTYQLTSTNKVGFNRNLGATWQTITIPLDGTLLKFKINQFTEFRILTTNAATTYRLDTIQLNSGINNPTGTISSNSFGFVNGSTGTATATTATDTLNVVGTGLATTSATGKTLTIAVPTPIPSQTGNTGKFLTTNGSVVSWGTPTDTGITSLNSLTGTTQTFATGTTGTDFGISSTGTTHTFNIPTASSSNRGLLSTSDWTLFNGKESALTFSSPLSRSTNTISIPAATSSVNGYLSSTDWSTFNGKQNAITLTTSGSSGSSTFSSNTLNVPTYTLAGLGGISLTSLSASSPLSYNNTTGAFSISLANTSTNGYLSSTDWNTFNGKLTLPSLTSGSVLFSNGTTIAQDNTNLFWDDTNNRLGVGTSSPSYNLDITGNLRTTSTINSEGTLNISKSGGTPRLEIQNQTASASNKIEAVWIGPTGSGYGAIQKFTASTTAYKIIAGSDFAFYNYLTYGDIAILNDNSTGKIKFATGSSSTAQMTLTSAGRLLLGGTTESSAALFRMDSTSSGFLPPRMTLSQRTGIATPDTGLIVYQTNFTEGLYVNSSTGWVALGTGTGSVTNVSVVSANGFAGSVATSTTTPAITLSTSVTGILKGDGTAISAATNGVDYVNSNIYTANGALSSVRTMDFVESSLYLGTSADYTNFAYHKKGIIPGVQILVTPLDRTLSSVTTAQAIYYTSFQSLNVLQSQTYFFEGIIYLTGMSATSGNLTLDIKGTGTATIGSIMYMTTGLDSTTPTTAAALSGGVSVTSAYTTPVIGATGTGMILRFEGTLRIALLGGGTLIPTLSLSTASAAVVKANSFFRIYTIGGDTISRVDN